MGAGYYVGDTHGADVDAKSEDELADQMVAEVTEGVGATGVRAGIIGELGCSWPLQDNERKVLRAGAQAQQRAGAAILIHPGRNEAAPAEIIEVLADAGACTGRVIMSHLDRTVRERGSHCSTWRPPGAIWSTTCSGGRYPTIPCRTWI